MLQEFSPSLERPAKERKLPCIWHPSGVHGGPALSRAGRGGHVILPYTKPQTIGFLRLLLIWEADSTG